MLWAVIWYWLFGIFTVADIITTKIALAIGMHEVNPILSGNTDLIIPLKLIVMLAVIVLIILTEKTSNGSGWVIPASGTCVTMIAVLNNIIQLSSKL